jgi:hypothetical protein
MGRTSGAIGALILAIAVYFALFWGYDALRILTSPTYGLEDVWRSQVVFGLGRYIGLAPAGLLKLSAVLGALKLTVAGVCTVHVIDRLRHLRSGAANNEVLETGLLVAVAVSIVAAAPAVWSENYDLLRSVLLQLLLAALAAVLCLIERSGKTAAETTATAEPAATPVVAATAPAAAPDKWFTPWRR